jgi:hypothetical protein
MQHPKLRELIHGDLFDISAVESQLSGFDACFNSLGVSVVGLNEAQFTRLTYDLTTHIAETLHRLNPQMTFMYVSAQGTDGTEKGRVMWARIKGRTENAIIHIFGGAEGRGYASRPGFIQPLDGIKSKTAAYRITYQILWPVMPLLKWLLPNQILTTRQIGQAALGIARRGYAKHVLEPKDIRIAAGN